MIRNHYILPLSLQQLPSPSEGTPPLSLWERVRVRVYSPKNILQKKQDII
jgi:hypothetical protein